MADPKHPQRFTEEFKHQIIGPCNAGKPASEIERGTTWGTRPESESEPATDPLAHQRML